MIPGFGSKIFVQLSDEWKGIKVWCLIALVLIGLSGAVLIFYSTVWGPWVFSDSTVYLTVAQNFIDGRGLGMLNPSGTFKPLYHFPPLYPLTLSILEAIGLDGLDAARVLNILLIAALVILLGLSFYHATQSPWLTLILSSTLVMLPALLNIFSGVMSEPLSIFLGFTGILLLMRFLDGGDKYLLVLSGLLVGLASLTRYIAIAYWVAGIGVLLILPQVTWKKRFNDLLQFFILGMMPVFTWFVWLSVQRNFARIFSVNSNIWTELNPFRMEFIKVVWSWIPFSDRFQSTSYNTQKNIVLLLVMFAMILITVSILRSKKNSRQDHLLERQLRLGFILIIFILSYVFVLVVAYLAANPRPDIDSRMLLPIELALYFMLFLSISFLRNIWSNLKGVNILYLIPLVLLFSFVPASIEMITIFHHYGYGYTSRYWRNSQTIKAVQGLSPEIPLISNEAAALLFYTGRPTFEIPELIYSTSLSTEFTRYGDNLDDQAQKLFREHHAALVLFESIYYQFERLDNIHAKERLDSFVQGMNIFAEYKDGTIYFYNPDSP